MKTVFYFKNAET